MPKQIADVGTISERCYTADNYPITVVFGKTWMDNKLPEHFEIYIFHIRCTVAVKKWQQRVTSCTCGHLVIINRICNIKFSGEFSRSVEV
jgi:hypothetical protein